jgi:ankyrin repeat protein
VKTHFAESPLPPWNPNPSQPGDAEPDEVTHAFWSACHGGQQQVAEYLLARGANLNWVGYDKLTPLGAASRSGANALVAWLIHRGAKNTDEISNCG